MKTEKLPRIPLESNGIQYNSCKNPSCNNFGIPASQDRKYGNSEYTIVSAGKDFPLLKCSCCGETPPLKSNDGIFEELERISSYLHISTKAVSCPDVECSNHSVSVGTKKAYRSFGTSSSGSKRYQCCACNKTFSVAKSTQWQHDTHHNIEIFKLLVNKVPLSRIINILDISWEVLYNRIEFIHKQCLAFASNRENKLQEHYIDRLYLAIDKQDYEVNWTERKDKRNVVLSAITSADNKTGYVFGVHPNFDRALNKDEIEQDAKENGDEIKKSPFRKYARVWLESDYRKSHLNSKSKRSNVDLVSSIVKTYDETTKREDVEAYDQKGSAQKLPSYGLQVRAEYTMIAHFYFLKKLLGNVGKWRFFLDQESGIRSACLSAFKDEVQNKTAEAFYVSIEKELTVDEKRKYKALSKKRFDEIKEANPNLSDNEVKIEMLKENIQSVMELGHWKDKWVKHPLPNMAEANKAMCWLTEHDEYDLTHKAWLYNKASLHCVDSFFEKIRRRVAMFERPIHSQGNNGRTWNGYAPYNPAMVVKMLEIFRVVHNYIDKKKEKIKIDGVEKTIETTPAMRLGLAQAPIDYKDVLYFE